MTFDSWYKYYFTHLKDIYATFQVACENNSVNWHKRISFTEFCEYIFENSNKNLNPWI